MLTYSTFLSKFQDLTQNATTSNGTRGMFLINQGLRDITTKYYFNEIAFNYPGGTVANQIQYNLPPDIKELLDVYILVGNLRYVVTEAPTAAYWDRLQFAQYTSDIPQYYWIFNKQLHLFPTPASSGDQITFRYKRRIKDLSQVDYTTGTVSVSQYKFGSFTVGSDNKTMTGTAESVDGGIHTTPALADNDPITLIPNGYLAALPGGLSSGTTYYAVNVSGSTFQISATSGGTAITVTSAGTGTFSYQVSSTTVTGVGTSWVDSMAGRWIQFAENSTSDTTAGDNNWYQIFSVESSTSLTLAGDYKGKPVSGGSYTIGEVPLVPEDHQITALFYALKVYFNSISPNPNQYKLYAELFDEAQTHLDAEFGNKSTDVKVLSNDTELTNPNLYTRNLG